MKVREMKKDYGELTRTLPNVASQASHQDGDTKVEMQSRVFL